MNAQADEPRGSIRPLIDNYVRMKYLVFLVAVFLFGGAARAQTDYLGSAAPPGHPRILLLKGEEDAIKRSVDGDRTWGKLQQAIVEESDRIMTLPPVERIKRGRRLLDKSR